MNKNAIIVRRHSAPSVVGLSLATIDRLRREGRFVPSVRLAENAVGFLMSDLDAWLAARKETRQ